MTGRSEFHFSTVAHLEYPAGPIATDLKTLQDGIAEIPPESLFYHITRIAVRHPRARDLPPNDFAHWTAVSLQDPETAERLASVGVQPLLPLEEVRQGLLRILGEALGKRRPVLHAGVAPLHFITSRRVKAPLELTVHVPEEVVDLWRQVEPQGAFYHLVEARLLGPPEDDLVLWLRERGALRLAESAEAQAKGGMPLLRLHREIGIRWRRSLIPARLLRRTEESEATRREEARAVVARFAERLRKPKEPR